jgi:hypothetical protein
MADIILEELLRERDWRRCAPDWESSTTEELLEGFMYFCSTFCYIRIPGKRIKFELRDAQVETVQLWLEERYTVALKARQIGFSTLVSIFCLWLTFFYDNRNIVMLSKTERDAIKLLVHAKYAFRFLPAWMKERGPIATINQVKMEFTNESIMESLPSASDPARGSTVFMVIVDELGQLPNSDEAWASIEPIADVGGRVIMLGTANGEGNLFHSTWVGSSGYWTDRDGREHPVGNATNRFKSIFHGWWAGDRDQDWYDSKKADLPDWQLAQEYPDNPDEAFLRSGRPVFNLDELRSIVTEPPIARGYLRFDAMNRIEFVEDGGALRIWEMPSEKGVYAIGADVAEGLEHGDYSAAHVIDARSHKVVAIWHGHIDPDLFGSDVLFKLGRFYNQALIGVESNNHGLTPLKALVREKYRNVYRQRRLDKRAAQPTETLGWRTTTASKPLAIDELARDLREHNMELLDSETIAELRTFVREGDGKMHGSPHDDRVMSLAIANQMLKYVFMREYRAKEGPPPGTWGHWLKQLFPDSEDKPTPLGAFGVRQAA